MVPRRPIPHGGGGVDPRLCGGGPERRGDRSAGLFGCVLRHGRVEPARIRRRRSRCGSWNPGGVTSALRPLGRSRGRCDDAGVCTTNDVVGRSRVGIMKFGAFVPQGWRMDLAGVAVDEQWPTMLRVAGKIEHLGYDTAWVYDHFHTVPR